MITFQRPIYYILLDKNIGYCHHTVYFITFGQAQSDHIKRLPLYFHLWIRFDFFRFSLKLSTHTVSATHPPGLFSGPQCRKNRNPNLPDTIKTFAANLLELGMNVSFFFIFLNQSNYDKSTTLEYTSGSQPLVTDDLQNSIIYNLATHSSMKCKFLQPACWETLSVHHEMTNFRIKNSLTGLPMCQYNVTMSVVSQLTSVCSDEFSKITKCAAGGRDHLPCCTR